MALYINPLVYRPEYWNEAVTVAASVDPVTLAEAKAHCRVDFDEDDTAISLYIASARDHVENHTRRAIITQTRTLKLPDFPADDQLVELPGGHIQSVTSIGYTDTSGDSQTFTGFSLTGNRLALNAGKTWPDTQSIAYPVTITYVCGYPGDGGSPEDLRANVPSGIKAAILMLVGHFYENREAVTEPLAELPLGLSALLSPYRVHTVFS